MGEAQPSFRTGAVRPVECLRAGWNLVKDQYWLLLGITVVGNLIGAAVPLGILAGPMMCGIYICLLRKMRGRPIKFEMLFKGFDHFVQSLIATLIMMVPILAVMIPGYVAVIGVLFATMPMTPPAGGGPPPKPDMTAFFVTYFTFLALLLAVAAIVSVLCYFVYPLIVDRKLSGVAAIKTSVRASLGNLGGLIGLVVLNFLLTLIGALACYVGAFFVLPIHFAAVAVAYRQVFPDEYVEPRQPTPEELDYDEQPDVDARRPERRDDER